MQRLDPSIEQSLEGETQTRQCKFREKITHFSGILLDYRQLSSFSKQFGEIPTKIHQNLASKWQNSIKNAEN